MSLVRISARKATIGEHFVEVKFMMGEAPYLRRDLEVRSLDELVAALSAVREELQAAGETFMVSAYLVKQPGVRAPSGVKKFLDLRNGTFVVKPVAEAA